MKIPVANLTRAKDNYEKEFQVFGDIYLQYEFIDGLAFKTLASGIITAFDDKNFRVL